MGGIFPDVAPFGNEMNFEFWPASSRLPVATSRMSLFAVFRAADNGGVISMEHLALALKREYQKLGKVCEKSDFERYYELVR